MSSDERLLLIDDLVYTNVGVEIGLNVFEHDDGTVSASTSVVQVCLSLRRMTTTIEAQTRWNRCRWRHGRSSEVIHEHLRHTRHRQRDSVEYRHGWQTASSRPRL